MNDIHKQDEFYDIQFKDLKLDEEHISQKTFENCQFNNLSASEATLQNCRFIDCEFNNSNLSTVNFEGSSFTDTVFDQCKLLGINWTKLKWPHIKLSSPLKFYKCNISLSSFFELELQDLIMEECIAHEVDFRGGDYSNASFILTDFQGSLFMHTKLHGADFTEAINYIIDPMQNTITKAKFTLPEAINLLQAFDIKIQN